MLLQLFAPAVVVAVGGIAAGAVLLQSPWPFGGFAPVGRALQLAALGAAAAMWAHSMWRVWRWERGREPQCPCGGLLSRSACLRAGQRRRRCLACRRSFADACAPPAVLMPVRR